MPMELMEGKNRYILKLIFCLLFETIIMRVAPTHTPFITTTSSFKNNPKPQKIRGKLKIKNFTARQQESAEDEGMQLVDTSLDLQK
jgi:hypothetical protein